MNKKVLHAFLTPTYCKILIHFFERSHHTSDNIYLKTNMENNYYISKLPSSIFKHKNMYNKFTYKTYTTCNGERACRSISFFYMENCNVHATYQYSIALNLQYYLNKYLYHYIHKK